MSRHYQFHVYALHHVGMRAEWRTFDTEEECAAFVHPLVEQDDEGYARATVRVFFGDELTWKPKDVVKSIGFVWPE